MKKYPNIKINVTILKELVIFTELFVFFLMISSSMAMASTGFSEESKPISASAKYSQRYCKPN